MSIKRLAVIFGCLFCISSTNSHALATSTQVGPSTVSKTFSGYNARGPSCFQNEICNPNYPDVRGWCQGLGGTGWNCDLATSDGAGYCSMVCHCTIPPYRRQPTVEPLLEFGL